jgi:PIN domain nuclease of toxin-antitoxin system
MNLLLDTHIWLWNDLQPEKISSQVALELASPSNDLWLSPVSIWELALLLEKKRITIPMEFHVWVAGSARDLDLREAPLPGTLLRSCERSCGSIPRCNCQSL